MPDKQQRITIPSLLRKLKATLDGQIDQSQNTTSNTVNNSQYISGHESSLKDRMTELMTKVSYEFSKANALAHDQTVDEQNFETIHKAFEKKLALEKEIFSQQHEKQIELFKE